MLLNILTLKEGVCCILYRYDDSFTIASSNLGKILEKILPPSRKITLIVGTEAGVINVALSEIEVVPNLTTRFRG